MADSARQADRYCLRCRVWLSGRSDAGPPANPPLHVTVYYTHVVRPGVGKNFTLLVAAAFQILPRSALPSSVSDAFPMSRSRQPTRGGTRAHRSAPDAMFKYTHHLPSFRKMTESTFSVDKN